MQKEPQRLSLARKHMEKGIPVRNIVAGTQILVLGRRGILPGVKKMFVPMGYPAMSGSTAAPAPAILIPVVTNLAPAPLLLG